MPAPQTTLWELDDHSQAKHKILRFYLGGWLPVMATWNKKLVLVDGFCGPGRYVGGEPGSPLIMLDVFLNHSSRDNIDAELVYLFIDDNQDRIDHLEGEINALGAMPRQVTIERGVGRFEDIFRTGLEQIQSKGKTLAPTFAFIDPFGYTQAPMDLTGSILQFDRCEVLVYMPLPHVNRFLGKGDQKPGLDRLFGTDEWQQALGMQSDERRAFLRDLFAEQMKKVGGVKYVWWFEIVTASGTGGYYLFFGTQHEKGLELMKGAMWKVDPVHGRRYRDPGGSDQLVLIEAEPDLEPLKAAIVERFDGTQFSISELEHFALVETDFLPTHVRTILKPLEDTGEVEILTSRKRRKTYPKGTEMRLSIRP